MKIRTIKLREAHKSTGNGSFCSILYDQSADHLVTASSLDPSISIHDTLLLAAPPKILRHHRDGVTALALSPNSTCLASGSIDHSVKLYKFPSGEFQTNITRFTLPIRVLSFNKSGTLLAAAGDDDGIKLINTIDGSIARVLKGHKGSITGIAFDPKGEYMASIDSSGSVIIWELSPGTIIHDLKFIAPETNSDSSIINTLDYSPDGEVLAIPGKKNDVILYDRDTAEKLVSLKGDHTKQICFISWSPNGKYMASSGLDKQVLIWDVDKKQDIDRQRFENRITCMSWKLYGNSLAVIDSMGKYGMWDPVVPLSMKSPTEDIPGLGLKTSKGFLLLDDEEKVKEVSVSGSLSDLGVDSEGESDFPRIKKLRKQTRFFDEWEDEDNDDDIKSGSHKKASTNVQSGKKTKDELKNTGCKLQEAFHPGVTPVQPGKKRFLCYNMLGCVTSMDHDIYSHIEVDFHDTSIPRVPAMTDHFGFTMASLNENGSVFANPCKSDKNLSMLMYKPFHSWANNSEWSMRFEDEEVKAVALGTDWVAAITSLNFLRIFTQGGLQTNILSLDGSVVSAVGYKDQLAIVTHSSTIPSNEQMLEFRVFNIHEKTQPIKGRLPLTPGSYLTWFGFSEEGRLSSFDSKGMLRVYVNQFGGNWVPLFSAIKLKKSDENYWVIGLNASKLYCVVCKSPDLYPQVSPKPMHTVLDLSFPIASSDLGAESLEKEFIIYKMQLNEIQLKIEEKAVTGQCTDSLDDEAFNIEAALDRCILRLIASCCNGDKLVRATELVKLLSLEKSVRGAIKLVTALKQPNLAERFNTLLEERLINKEMVTNGDDLGKDEVMITKTVSPLVSTSTYLKKEGSEEQNKSGKRKIEEIKSDNNNKLEKIKEVKIIKEMKNNEDVKKESCVRPSNPFAKPLNNQGNTSFFDSIKKMKK